MDPIFLIVLIAFAGPIIGSLIGIMRRPSFIYVCCMLCFAAGVMLAISFLELIPESMNLSSTSLSGFGLIAGALVMYALDRLLPHIHPSLCRQEQGCNLERSSVYLIIGIFLHNFPEGMAVSVPLRREGISRWKAFLLGQASGTVEPIAGVLGAAAVLLMRPILPYALAFAAGAMIYVVVEELIPESQLESITDVATIGAMLGFAVMMTLDVALG